MSPRDHQQKMRLSNAIAAYLAVAIAEIVQGAIAAGENPRDLIARKVPGNVRRHVRSMAKEAGGDDDIVSELVGRVLDKLWKTLITAAVTPGKTEEIMSSLEIDSTDDAPKQYPPESVVIELKNKVCLCIEAMDGLSTDVYFRQPDDGIHSDVADIDIEVAPEVAEIVEAGPNDGAEVFDRISVNVTSILRIFGPEYTGPDTPATGLATCYSGYSNSRDGRQCVEVHGTYQGFRVSVAIFMDPFPDEKATKKVKG